MKVALIEIGGSHDECLYSQVKIIKSAKNIHLTLICNESLKANVAHYDKVDTCKFVTVRSGFKQWLDLFNLWKYCRAQQFDKIIFNTAQGKVISRFLRFSFGNQTKLYGTLHDVNKLKSSGSQKIITKKIAHYFVLSAYLEEAAKKLSNKSLSFSVFYPIFFPCYPELTIAKKKYEKWVCIPGQVELKRRDYTALFESIKKQGVATHIKFILLGRYGHQPWRWRIHSK